MGFLTNVLEYGFTAGSIITKAEKEADRICKGIKTTIIEEDDEKEDGKSDSDDVDMTGCKIIFHPEWLSEDERERVKKEFPELFQKQQDENFELEVIENKSTNAVDSIEDTHADIMEHPDEKVEDKVSDEVDTDTGDDDIV